MDLDKIRKQSTIFHMLDQIISWIVFFIEIEIFFKVTQYK